MEAVTRRSKRRLSRIAKGLPDPLFKTSARADSQRWRPHRLFLDFGKLCLMGIEPPQPAPPPSMAERAIDTATDASRTIEEVTTGLKVAIDRLRSVIEHAQRPGQPLARLRATTREAH
jgi:hypothetical protein